jgi:hypothetical protein
MTIMIITTTTIIIIIDQNNNNIKITPWPESARELYRPSDHRLSAKLVPTFAYRKFHTWSHDGSLRPYSRLFRPEPLLFPSSSSSLVLTGLSGPR